MRAYFFVNSWLSDLQKGLQVAHCVAEMSRFSPTQQLAEYAGDYIEWAENHKTIIILNGGSHGDLVNLSKFFKQEWNKLVWSFFSEDDDSLNGAMTCVGVLAPEDLWKYAQTLREEGRIYDTENLRDGYAIWEAEFINLLNSYSLA